MTDNLTTAELLKTDIDYLVHPGSFIGQNLGVVIKKGHGVFLEDTDGKEYIDGQSQLTCVNLGYGQKEIHNAVAEQLGKLEYSTLFFGFCTEESIKCAKKLAGLTPDGLNHIMFTSGGSESTDTAIRIARQYWYNQGIEKYKIISLYNSYHGVTYGSLASTGLGKGFFNSGVGPLAHGSVRIPSYYCYRCAFGKKYPDCGIQCAKFLAETIEQEGAGSVAAFIAEPIHGTAGMITPPPEYWPMVRKICLDYDVLLIADEVMTGFGRTGKLFAMEHWDVKPDIMTMAKGLTTSYIPFGAIAVSDAVAEALEGAMVFGFTYSGHPAGCAAAMKAMDIYTRDNIAENAAEVGKYTLERLNAEFMPLPCIDAVGGLGLMLGMEIVADKKTRATFPIPAGVPEKVQTQARQNGLLLRTTMALMGPGDRICFTPPLTITRDEVDKALDILLPIVSALKPV
jgi:putrescine aminotransferase